MSITAIPIFINKVYEIINDPQYSEYCGWSPSGDTILIKKINKFCNSVVPKYFKHANFHSFVRQLNMYDFKKIGHTQSQQQVEFENIYFKKSQPELLHFIKRKAGTVVTTPDGSTMIVRRHRRNDKPRNVSAAANKSAAQRYAHAKSTQSLALQTLSTHPMMTLPVPSPAEYFSDEDHTTEDGQDTPLEGAENEVVVEDVDVDFMADNMFMTVQAPMESISDPADGAGFDDIDFSMDLSHALDSPIGLDLLDLAGGEEDIVQDISEEFPGLPMSLLRTMSEEEDSRKRKRSIESVTCGEVEEISTDLMCDTLKTMVNVENEILGHLKSSYSSAHTTNSLKLLPVACDEEFPEQLQRKIIAVEGLKSLPIMSSGGIEKPALKKTATASAEVDVTETLELFNRMQYLEESNADTFGQNVTMLDELSAAHNRSVQLYRDVGIFITAMNDYVAKKNDVTCQQPVLPAPLLLSPRGSSTSKHFSPPRTQERGLYFGSNSPASSAVSHDDEAISGPPSLYRGEDVVGCPQPTRYSWPVTANLGSTYSRSGSPQAASLSPNLSFDALTSLASFSLPSSPAISRSVSSSLLFGCVGTEPVTRQKSFGSDFLRSSEPVLHRSDSFEFWGI